MEIIEGEARCYIAQIGPNLGYDSTYPEHFPEGRRDVAVLEHHPTNGRDYGFTVVYAVAKTADGGLRCRELLNSRQTKDYLFIEGVFVEGETLKVEIRNPGTYSGQPRIETIELPLRELGL